MLESFPKPDLPFANGSSGVLNILLSVFNVPFFSAFFANFCQVFCIAFASADLFADLSAFFSLRFLFLSLSCSSSGVNLVVEEEGLFVVDANPFFTLVSTAFLSDLRDAEVTISVVS